MTKYYTYHEPGERGDVQVIMSVKAIIKERIQIAESHGKAYQSASAALDEWIVVNWAYPCTREGKTLLTPNLEQSNGHRD